MTWTDDQEFERKWWSDCRNTFAEETKQITYAHRMGLVIVPDPDEKWPLYDLQGKSVVDIGGGPVSMLLKCRNLKLGLVVDPCGYPEWVRQRYAAAGIEVVMKAGEDFGLRSGSLLASMVAEPFDEAWIYNCLQHTRDPERIIANARRSARLVRLFEFPFTAPHLGHPQTLLPDQLDEWLGGKGTVAEIHENAIHGLCYFGVFPGLA